MGKRAVKTSNDLKKTAAPKTEAVNADNRKRKWLIVFAIVALVGTVCAVVGVFFVNYFESKELDYINGNLSRYVHIAREDYLNFPVEILRENISEIEIEDALMRSLAAHKDGTPLHGGAALTNGVIGVGDDVTMYYRGYTVDGDGNHNYFGGGCNFADEEPESQIIGSSTRAMYPGFELGLIGVDPYYYSNANNGFSVKTSGTVGESDVIVVSYIVFYSDGTAKQISNEVISLSETTLDAEYGEGFREFFVGKKIGEIEDKFECEGENGITTIYGEFKIEKAITLGKNPIVVTAFAPKNIDVAQIAGQTLYFEVYVKNFIDYVAPEANDAFVTEKLKLSAADLSQYEGDSLIDKYRKKLEAELIEERTAAEKTMIEDALWELLMSKAVFKRLPAKEVENQYQRYYDELYSQYESYSYAYSSFEEFARASLDLDYTESWQDVLKSDAEEAVKNKLVFYYVLRAEDFIPVGEEFDRLFESSVEDHVVSYIENAYGDKEFTEEQYASTVASVRKIVMDYYGEAYFRETVYYSYGMDKLLTLAKVNYK